MGIHSELKEPEVPGAFKNGTLLTSLLSALDSKLNFRGLNSKPVARRACLHNIEEGLRAIWKKGVRATAMPSAEQVYSGNRVWQLLDLVFREYVLKSLKEAPMWKWYSEVLLHYELTPAMDSVSLACVLNCFFKLDLQEIYSSPQNPEETTHNLELVFGLIKQVGIPVCVAINEFLQQAETDFTKLQFYYVYRALSDRTPRKIDPAAVVFKDDVLKGKCKYASSVFSLESDLSYSHSSISRIASKDKLPPPGYFSQLTPRSGDDSTKFSSEYSPRPALDTSTASSACLETMNAHMERRYMYIEELRNASKPKTLENAMSLKNMRVSFENEVPQTKQDSLCVLLAPRILKLLSLQGAVPYLFNLNIDQFSLDQEEYSFEWKTLQSLETVGQLKLNCINQVQLFDRVLELETEDNLFKIQCYDEKEAINYYSALNYLLFN